MAPDEPSAPRRRRRSPLESPAASPAVVAPVASLAQLIEQERIELMQIHAMARCLNDVLLYADDDDSPMHADVAYVVARLLDDSIARLEAVCVRVAQLESAVANSAADSEPPPPHQVREPRATYLC
jgi:hypothetical protein